MLLYTSDEHSHAFAFAPEFDDYPTATSPGSGALEGGVLRRAVLLESEREAAQAAGKSVLTVSAGDNQMGTPVHLGFRSHSLDYATMVALGYDVTTLGNHEFDFGPQALAESLTAAQGGAGLPPIVATNIRFSEDDAGDDALAAQMGDALHRSHVITTPEGIRVGFVGFVGVNAADVARDKDPVAFSEAGLADDDRNDPELVLPQLYADLQPVVDELRDGGADVVVALSHAGIVDPSDPASGEDYLVAQNVAGIDVIISGHAHNTEPEPVIVENVVTGRDVVVLHGGAEGRYLGRAELVVGAGQAPQFDASAQDLMPIDDRIVPPAPADSPVDIDALLASVEQSGSLDGKTFLEGLLARVEGTDVSDDTAVPGDLYFRQIGKTDFDITSTHATLFLTADAQLRAVESVAPAQMGLQSAGVIRWGLAKGETGVVSAADAFNVLPLGASPLDGTYGYPLIVARLPVFYVRAIFEFAASWGGTNSDFDLAPSGVTVEYDCSRPMVTEIAGLFDPEQGVVSKIFMDSDHSDGFEQFDTLIWDRTNPAASISEPVAIVTSSYICQFANEIGATPLGPNGEDPITCEAAVVQRTNGSEIKEVEALMSQIREFPGGTIPALYDRDSASRSKRFDAFPGCR